MATYEVGFDVSALGKLRVRARSRDEAVGKAVARLDRHMGQRGMWTLTWPGDEQDHVSYVLLNGQPAEDPDEEDDTETGSV